MNKNKILTVFVVVLVVLNSAALVYLWKSNAQKRKHDGMAPATYLIQKVGMDSLQKEKYYALIKQHRKSTERLKRDLKDARELYYGMLGKNENDSSLHSALSTISRLNTELTKITFEHFSAVRKICTPQQQVKFDATIEEVINMMAGPPKGPPGPGAHPRPHPGDGPPPGMDDED